MPELKSTAQTGAVTSVYIDFDALNSEQWILVMSDNHHDSAFCNRKVEKKHLDEAKEKKAVIVILGDFFDAMQGKFDPRRSMEGLRPEYRVDNYFDFVCADSAKFLAPYAAQIVMIAKGNHEASILKNNNVDLTDRLVSQLNDKHGGHVLTGGYGGYIRFMCSAGSPKGSIRVKYYHGSGGEAPVTRGAITTNRQSVYIPDADVIINGHSHNAYEIPIVRERLSNKGKIYFDTCYHLRVPGYNMSYGDGSGGWEVERGGVPKPCGAYWLKLWLNAEGAPQVQPISAIEAPCAA